VGDSGRTSPRYRRPNRRTGMWQPPTSRPMRAGSWWRARSMVRTIRASCSSSRIAGFLGPRPRHPSWRCVACSCSRSGPGQVQGHVL